MEFLKSPGRRGTAVSRDIGLRVAEIVEDIRENGDRALLDYNRTFDGCCRDSLRVSAQEIARAREAVPPREMDDLRRASENIRAFAVAQREAIKDIPSFCPLPGVTLGHRAIPVRDCCCYVPGGGYPLYSTALMLAIPAKVAGVPRVAACSPVMKGTNDIHPKTLAAMDMAGVDEIYAVGGAQAIAAFAYGTGQIRPVDLIVGPGNSFVAEAKRQCFGQVGIDFVAGPSEVLIIADGTADSTLIAADLLAQCEHDRIARGMVVTTDRALGRRIIEQIEAQLKDLDTSETAKAAWDDFGEVILADGIDEAVDIANKRAPEHLELQTASDGTLAGRLFNYGSLFIGKYSAEVFGDYASGTNHTLPTMGAARYTGGIWAGTFLKICTHQTLERRAMPDMAPLVSRLARGEGLTAHARAAERRCE
ncbi:MAG: histidinol dehydrogenase [Synergistaceae bacterium]|jgi:histidinol dehydrogenase|nr:histidinol dehydrogenase [Synergistaceae bacterium]